MASSIFILRVLALILVWDRANCQLENMVSDFTTTLNNTAMALDALLARAPRECPLCPDPCDENCVMARLAMMKIDLEAIQTDLAAIGTLRGETCCRYTPPTGPNMEPGFVVFNDGANILFTTDSAGTQLGNLSFPIVRGLYYNPFTRRVFVFRNPILSYDVDLTGEQNLGNSISGTPMSLDGDPFKNELYMSVSLNKIYKLNMDGTGQIQLAFNADVTKPRQNKIDTCKGILYWTDQEEKAVKSVNVDGTPNVTTIFTHTQTLNGMDIDFAAKKIYWCAKTTGKVFVYDMVGMSNTELAADENRGSCYNLRLYNGFMYLTHYRSDHIVKRYLNGTLAGTPLAGQLAANKAKYIALIV